MRYIGTSPANSIDEGAVERAGWCRSGVGEGGAAADCGTRINVCDVYFVGCITSGNYCIMSHIYLLFIFPNLFDPQFGTSDCGCKQIPRNIIDLRCSSTFINVPMRKSATIPSMGRTSKQLNWLKT
jgi:hypothetical protein